MRSVGSTYLMLLSCNFLFKRSISDNNFLMSLYILVLESVVVLLFVCNFPKRIVCGVCGVCVNVS